MSDKTKAASAAKPDPKVAAEKAIEKAAGAAPKAKKPRAPREAMGVVERTKLANMIEAEYSNSRLTDAEFAEYAEKKLSIKVPVSSVTSIREAYKLAAPPVMSAGEMRQRIRQLEDALSEANATIEKLRAEPVSA